MLRRAGPPDVDVVVALVREFYEVDQHAFDEAHVRAALTELLASDRHGVVWLVLDPGAGSCPLGYAVLTWGYSVESGGREALVDEVYVRRRDQGTGGTVMAAILDVCRAEGVRRVFLETERHNVAARRFYTRHGFEVDDSIWMSCWL